MRGSRPLTRVAALLLVAMLGASGCVFTGSLDAGGGGRLTLRYRLVSVLYFDQHKAALQSADVSLRNSALAPGKWATFDLEFRDVRKLSTAPLLANLHVDLQDDADGMRRLAVRLDNKVPQPMPELFQAYLGREFRLSAELPAPVIATNATAIDGRTASWSLLLADISQQPALDFFASFRAPTSPGAAPPGG